eukprot:843409_1
MSGRSTQSGTAVKSEPIDQSNIIPPQKSTSAFKCQLCVQEFNIKDHLIQHVINYHNMPLATVKSEGNSEPSRLLPIPSHSQRTQSQTSCTFPKFKCAVCTKSFTYQSKLIQHEISHSDERPFQCNSCKKTFKRHKD